jgi:hypothetical protein
MSFCSKAPQSKTEITIGSPAAEQGWPVARGGRTLASGRLGWGLNSPSIAWCGRFSRKRLRRRSATREIAVSRGGRNSVEQAGRLANARAQEGPRVRVEATTMLKLEQGRWPVGAPACSDRQRRRARRCGSELRPSKCEAGGVRGASGGSNGAHARQVARSAAPRRVVRDAWPSRRRANGAARSSAARTCGRAGARPRARPS